MTTVNDIQDDGDDRPTPGLDKLMREPSPFDQKPMNDVEAIRHGLETGLSIAISEFETGRNSRESIERSWQPAFEALDRLEAALRKIAWLETSGMEGYDEAVDIARQTLDPSRTP